MEVFAKLLSAHLVADFILQSKNSVEKKQAKKLKALSLYLHVLIHSTLYFLVLGFESWDKIGIICLTHFAIDAIKLYLNETSLNKRMLFFMDQLLHIVVLFVVVQGFETSTTILTFFSSLNWNIVTAYIFLSLPAGFFIGTMTSKWQDEFEVTAVDEVDPNENSLKEAGKYIGVLERMMVLTFILMGHWEAIGLLITAKSVFRFSDLKNSNSRKHTEYVLIGTLLSFSFAIAIGILCQYLIIN